MLEKIAVILSKARAGQPSCEAFEKKLILGLGKRPDVDLTVIPHLYDLAADGPAMQHLKSIPGDMIVLAWLYPRSAYWVLDANGIRGRLGRTSSLPDEEPDEVVTRADTVEVPDRTVWCFDLRTSGVADACLEEIGRIAETVVRPVAEEAAAAPGPNQIEEATRSRWYPVIDYRRCTNCLECLNFCLFGVFELDGLGVISIEQPDACRPGCPACARICPAGAIMFPQHDDPGIAGDPKASLEGLKLDLSQLFGGATPEQLAAAERDRALAEKRRWESQSAESASDKDDLDGLVDELDQMDL